MSVVPSDLDTERQPPMTVPLRHFLVALGFLVAGSLVGVGTAAGVLSSMAGLAHVHLLLAGWVCITIMGAMTQFVPVWSGTQLHSRRLATVQLWLVAVGLVGFALGLLTGHLTAVSAFGAIVVLGFWVFVYNVGRTLWGLDTYDVTERHFAVALGFFLLLTALGALLAVGFVRPVFGVLPVTRADAVAAHATLAVFGAVLTTVIGALYQLATMFTQTELHGADTALRRFEAVGYPAGVVALALGRLLGVVVLARLGGVLVAVSLLGVSVVLARRLFETRVEWTPMLRRYAVLAVSMAAWALMTVPAWLRDPLAPEVLFGAPGSVHLLALGVVGFVVLGTLYHVVPFIVWVHRYSDRLGYEAVPMVDDLYADRVATADFLLFVTGAVALIAAERGFVSDQLTVLGGGLVATGTVLFVWNLLAVLKHSPQSLPEIIFSDRLSAGGDE